MPPKSAINSIILELILPPPSEPSELEESEGGPELELLELEESEGGPELELLELEEPLEEPLLELLDPPTPEDSEGGSELELLELEELLLGLLGSNNPSGVLNPCSSSQASKKASSSSP